MESTAATLHAISTLLLLAAVVLGAPRVWALEAEEEFLGPFATWTNVKTTYGAVGNGVADDKAAIQTGLNALAAGTIHTLYFPAGTYLLSDQIALTDALAVRVIGEHPATTILKWAGPGDGRSMFRLNGTAYSTVSRLTIDGNNVSAVVGINQQWDCTGGNFDTGNEYLDMIFTRAVTGLSCGGGGCGCAETTVRRAAFHGHSGEGISLWNFNALDMWVWDSLFEGCGRGITNLFGAGAFRAYRNVFQASTTADMEIGNTQVFAARDNFSIGSARFWVGGATGNQAPVVLHANTIIDSVNNDTIQVANQGPLLLFDNVIRVKSGGTAPLVTHAQAGNSDTVSLSNTYTVASAVSATGRLLADGDTVVSRASIAGTVPTLPDVAVSQARTVYEVPAGSSVATIQGAITSAVATGNKAVVHLQAGTTTIATTLTIPANADIHITGDGFGKSLLSWSGASNTPMLQITGPTKVRLQDVQLHAQSSADGIVMEGIDQMGARLHFGQLQLRQGFGSHLRVLGLNQAGIEWVNSNSAYMTAGTAVQVVGGRSPTILYGGASSTNIMQYTASGGGTLIVRDMYYETNASASFASFTDRGTVVFDSLRIAVPALWLAPGIVLTNWQGPATFLGSTLDDRFVLSGTGSAMQFLGLGMVGGADANPYLVDTTSPAAAVVLANSRRRLSAGGSEATATVGTVVPSAIQAQTALTRSLHLVRMTETAAGVSDIRLQRVWIRDARHAVTVTGTPDLNVLRLVR